MLLVPNICIGTTSNLYVTSCLSSISPITGGLQDKRGSVNRVFIKRQQQGPKIIYFEWKDQDPFWAFPEVCRAVLPLPAVRTMHCVSRVVLALQAGLLDGFLGPSEKIGTQIIKFWTEGPHASMIISTCNLLVHPLFHPSSQPQSLGTQ